MNNQMVEQSKAVRLAMSTPRDGACGKTGNWRTFRPVVQKDVCNSCGICALYCPDGVIDEEYVIDLVYCKGCGICATECPKQAIDMVREKDDL
jgi:pyruvate ferredoxin oxidoreductase delta subunit